MKQSFIGYEYLEELFHLANKETSPECGFTVYLSADGGLISCWYLLGQSVLGHPRTHRRLREASFS